MDCTRSNMYSNLGLDLDCHVRLKDRDAKYKEFQR